MACGPHHAPVSQAERIQPPRLAFGAAYATHLETESNVVGDGQVREQGIRKATKLASRVWGGVFVMSARST